MVSNEGKMEKSFLNFKVIFSSSLDDFLVDDAFT